MRKRYHMDEHIRTHTGESFGCPDCSYSTAKKSNLNRHMKKQHNTTISDVIKDDGKNDPKLKWKMINKYLLLFEKSNNFQSYCKKLFSSISKDMGKKVHGK